MELFMLIGSFAYNETPFADEAWSALAYAVSSCSMLKELR